MNTLEDILIILSSVKADLFNKYGLNFMAVLESSLSDEPILTAGIGIVVEFENVTGQEFVKLQTELSELLRRSVHLIVKNGMSEEMFDRMKADMHVLRS